MDYEDGGSDLLLDSRSYVVNVDDPLHGPLETALDRAGLLEPGNTLVQSPYDPDRYLVVNEPTTLEIAVQKLNYFVEFCQILGARSARAVEVTRTSRSGTVTAKLGGSLSPSLPGPAALVPVKVSGSTSIGGGLSLEEEQRLSVECEWAGGPPSLDDAERFVERHRLLNDSTFTSLLQARRHRANPIAAKRFELELSEQATANLELASQLVARVGWLKGSVDGKIQAALNQKRSYKLSMVVAF